MSMGRVLVVDDQPAFRRLLVRILSDAGYDVTEARNGQHALDLARKSPFHVVFSDVNMPKLDGMGLLAALTSEAPETVVVMVTAHGSVEMAVDAMRQGAFDFLPKPLEDNDEVRRVADKAIAHRRLVDAHDALATVTTGPELVYADASMERVAGTVGRVAATDATVLVTGESGTGKELVARMIHDRSPRRARPFVAVNCAALAEGLLDSELFGHERGAFTGAERQRRGRFEVADGGTLFLDEIGETSGKLQAKLLRVLQERAFERVGGTATIEVDVRLVTATNRHLAEEVGAGRFREDLYYRLNVVPIHLPPLRERGQDVVLLARHLIGQLGRKHGRPSMSLGPDAERALLAYPWPGNVRELTNVMERAAILCPGDVIGAGDLLLAPAGQPPRAGGASPTLLNLKDLERDAIVRALRQTEGNRREASDLLGIGLRTLHYKLNEYDLRD